MSTETANVPVDPSQLPVEVPLTPPVSLLTLIALSGFDQLVLIILAVASLILNFKLGGRTLTNRQHAAVVNAVAQIKHTADEMHPDDADD